MARFVAGENQLAFRWESGTYGLGPQTALWPGLVQESAIDESTGIIPIRYLGTSTRNVDQFVEGPKDVTGTFSYFPQDWRIAVAALGLNTDAGSPTPYTHTITELESDASAPFTSGTLCPFTSFQVQDAKQFNPTGLNFVRTVKGCNVNAWTLNGAQGEILSVDVDYIGQDVDFTSGAALSITENTTRPFLWSDVNLHLPSGTVLEEMKSFTLSVNNNLQAPHYLNGSQVIAPPIPLNRDYSMSVTLDSTSSRSKTFWETYLTGGSSLSSSSSPTFNMMLEVNASTGSRDAYFVMSGCKLLDADFPSPQEGVNETTLTIQPENMKVIINDTTFRYNPW